MVFPEPGKPARMTTCWEGDAMRANFTYQESGGVLAGLIVGSLILFNFAVIGINIFIRQTPSLYSLHEPTMGRNRPKVAVVLGVM